MMRELPIAYGNSRQAKKWVNKTISYEALKERLKVPIRTTESAEEYAKMKKADKDSAKDHGGFVAGILEGGRRLSNTVESRSMIALDGDRITPEFLDSYEENVPYTSVLYSTHSSTEEAPRARILFPLVRDVSPEEFVAVSRYVAQGLGIDNFDECSYLTNQLMYWPSCPSNGKFVYLETDKGWIDPDVILAAHPEWKDPTRLPTSSRESRANSVKQKKVADPLEKEGVVGIFNRTYYPVTLVLEKYLSDVYEPTDNPNRWHLIASSSMAGVEIIEDKFVYSHHAKDPAYLHLCNAFDIVRMHRFGDLEDKASYSAMCDLAVKDDQVSAQILEEKQAQAEKEFANWEDGLRYDKKGDLQNSLHNLTLIMENDEYMQHIVFNQLADGMEIKGEVPWQHPARFWRDADDAQLICYVDAKYGTFSARNYTIAIAKAVDDRSYHPIREMFEALPPWDGVARVDTLLIDYLGAEDNAYVRAVTRKALCAAYMRVWHPGIKFDYITVLNGDQGIGKSTLIAKLGMEWFSDSLNISDMNDKTAAEKLQGFWIHEISEMAGMRKADLEKVKSFVSRQDDKYRASFGRRVTPHPRQCVFFGTTNSQNGYLRDITGNRRFWNVKVTGEGRLKPWDLDQDTVDQIWAETMVLAKAGEKLFLDHDLETLARKEQSEAMESDEREGFVREFLDMFLPENWDTMDTYQRREYFQDPNGPLNIKGTVKRETVSNIEIWCECFGKRREDMKPSDSYAIAAIMEKIEGWDRTGKPRRLPIYGRQRIYERAR